MTKPDPYADLDEVYAQETSPERIKVQPTPKAPTDDAEQEKDNPTLPNGMRIV